VAVRRALLAAIRARPGAARAFIASPGRDFRDVDRGGRTRCERAFTRSAYYQVVKVPQHRGLAQEWSLKLTWGPIERRGSRYGRTVQLKMFPYRAGARYANSGKVRTWRDNPELRSTAGDRIDQRAS
jgi:hypothetical protein